jgi:hypothetical protein
LNLNPSSHEISYAYTQEKKKEEIFITLTISVCKTFICSKILSIQTKLRGFGDHRMSANLVPTFAVLYRVRGNHHKVILDGTTIYNMTNALTLTMKHKYQLLKVLCVALFCTGVRNGSSCHHYADDTQTIHNNHFHTIHKIAENYTVLTTIFMFKRM